MAHLRRAILFLFASAVLGGGALLLSLRFKCELGFAHGVCPPIQVRLLAMVAFLIFLGGFVLWTEFIMPWLSEVSLFGIFAKRRRRAALKRIDLSDRSRTPLAEERGVTPIPLRLKDLEVLRQLGEAELADEYLAAWEEWKAKHPQREGKR
jgi:hypothetical protein